MAFVPRNLATAAVAVAAIGLASGCSASTTTSTPSSASSSPTSSSTSSPSSSVSSSDAASLCDAIANAMKLKPADGQPTNQSEAAYRAYSEAWSAAAALAADNPSLAAGLNTLAAVNAKPTANSPAEVQAALKATAEIAPVVQAECGLDIFE